MLLIPSSLFHRILPEVFSVIPVLSGFYRSHRPENRESSRRAASGIERDVLTLLRGRAIEDHAVNDAARVAARCLTLRCLCA
jgi:hypothetical protein